MRTPFARRRFGSPGTFPREGIPRYYHGPKAEFHSREEMRHRSTKFSVCRRFLETLSPCSLGLIRQFLPPGSRPRGSMRFTIWGCGLAPTVNQRGGVFGRLSLPVIFAKSALLACHHGQVTKDIHLCPVSRVDRCRRVDFFHDCGPLDGRASGQ